MSKIRLHGSSSGYMEIAPPAAASSATVTLPNSAGEVLLTDGSAASLTQIPAANIVGVCTAGLGNASGAFSQGKILQVKQTFKNDTTSVANNSQTSFVDMTGMSVDITPTSSTSKILISLTVNVSAQAEDRNNSIRLLRDSTVIGAGTGGSTSNAIIYVRTKDNDYLENKSSMFLDSPNTTSQITYKLQWCSEGSGGSAKTWYLNRRSVGNYNNTSSHITAMEVAA